MRNRKTILKNLSPADIRSGELAGEQIQGILTKAPGDGGAIGGVKVVAERGWFAARPSGTEEIYKIYAESFRGPDHLEQIEREARAMIAQAFASAQGTRSAPG